MKLRPLFDKIVVRRAESRKRSDGGILLPEQSQEKAQKGEVLAVGEGAWSPTGTEHRRPPQTKVGDVVLFTKWAGSDHAELGDDVVVLSEGDVLGIVEPEGRGKK